MLGVAKHGSQHDPTRTTAGNWRCSQGVDNAEVRMVSVAISVFQGGLRGCELANYKPPSIMVVGRTTAGIELTLVTPTINHRHGSSKFF